MLIVSSQQKNGSHEIYFSKAVTYNQSIVRANNFSINKTNRNKMLLFLNGLMIGFSVAAPLGPVGILCIHRCLINGFNAGLIAGLGAALADAVFCLIALGLTTQFMVGQQFWIRLIGGLFLIALGCKMILSDPYSQQPFKPVKDLWHSFLTTFTLTLLNPLTIVAFIAIFAILQVSITQNSVHELTFLVGGVFLGSVLWWIILSGSVSLYRHRFQKFLQSGINFVSGTIILFFGLLALMSLHF
jgi:threonine/homoserine/homoserine lactone efflux protein